MVTKTIRVKVVIQYNRFTNQYNVSFLPDESVSIESCLVNAGTLFESEARILPMEVYGYANVLDLVFERTFRAEANDYSGKLYDRSGKEIEAFLVREELIKKLQEEGLDPLDRELLRIELEHMDRQLLGLDSRDGEAIDDEED